MLTSFNKILHFYIAFIVYNDLQYFCYNLIEDFKKFLQDEDRDYYNCEPFEFYKAQDEIADPWINAVLDYKIRTIYYYDANNEEFEVTFVE